MNNTKMSPRQLLMQRIAVHPLRRLLKTAVDVWVEQEICDSPLRKDIVERERKALRHVIELLSPADGKHFSDENIYPQYSETNTLAQPGVCENPNENLLKACKSAREAFRAMGDNGFDLYLECNAAILEAEEVYL